MTDPLVPPETFADAMDEAENALHGPPFGRGDGAPLTAVIGGSLFLRPDDGIPTIDRDLGPVEAAPRLKGPKWRLQMLREWSEETCPPGPRRRALKEKRR
jgi:hypothetical protein